MDSPSDPVYPIVGRLVRDFPGLNTDALPKYLAEIVRWNQTIPLVSRKTTLDVIDRMVRQSAALYDLVVREISEGGRLGPLRIVDVGTGAGFPGVVWKLIEPDANITLVERNQKKVTFLQRLSSVMRFSDLEVIASDVEAAARRPELSRSFDLAVTFAVGGPERLARHFRRLLRANGWYATLRPLDTPCEPPADARLYTTIAAQAGLFGYFCVYQLVA